MNWLLLTLISPLAGGLVLAFTRHAERAFTLNILFSATTFIGTLGLALDTLNAGTHEVLGGFFFLDAYNLFLIALTSFVAMTTAIYSGAYMRFEWQERELPPHRLRLYHAMYQLFIFGMLLGFTTNNIGLMWIALELATLATVLLVSLYRTPASIAAAWKYFMLAGMGIALALFGTILIFFTSSSIFGHSNDALTWTMLYTHGGELEPTVMIMAFAFLMIGYGTKIGLVPMHTWLPDAHGEGPTPVSAVLSGLLLNLALYNLVRFKMVVDLSSGNQIAGDVMILFGVLSLIVAAFSLHR